MQAKNSWENKNVYFVSLGCPKNLVDSEVMLGVLAKAKYKLSQTPDDAGIIVVNTCGFIDASKEESINTVLELAAYKKTHACHTLVMTGCLVQRYPHELSNGLEEVDLFIGTSEYHKIAEYLTSQRISPDGPRMHLTAPTYIHSHDTPRVLTGAVHSAFLKVSEGCNKRCSFCIIPTMRGDVRSRPIPSLVQEATQLVQQGARELCLIAQDLTDYGIDLKDRRALPKLLRELVRIPDLKWIRLFYSYPDGISDELIDLMASEPKICRYLDLPLQHASDAVLKRMNRAIRKDKMIALIERLRVAMPDISLRTSFIVGFPGETEEQFQELCDVATWARLDHVGVFAYSKEEGTASYDLEGHLPFHVKQERKKNLQNILHSIALEKAQARVGKTELVLIDGPHPESPDFLLGRTQGQAKEIDTHVIVNDAPAETTVGDFCYVEITDTAGPDLVGRVTKIQAKGFLPPNGFVIAPEMHPSPRSL